MISYRASLITIAAVKSERDLACVIFITRDNQHHAMGKMIGFCVRAEDDERLILFAGNHR
jgi:hypothetical protein